jgi:hypothetical protein
VLADNNLFFASFGYGRVVLSNKQIVALAVTGNSTMTHIIIRH